MAFVLCIGTDPELMKDRQMTLERAGHKVIAVVNQNDLMSTCKKNKFDVVIIGQTLVPEMKQHVVDLVREHCSEVKILELYSISDNRTIEDADDWIEVDDNVPPDLPEHVRDLAA